VASVWCRGDYFKALFRQGGMRESAENRVMVESYNVPTLRRMLEFVYTNRIDGLTACGAPELIDLMGLADEYLLTVRWEGETHGVVYTHVLNIGLKSLGGVYKYMLEFVYTIRTAGLTACGAPELMGPRGWNSRGGTDPVFGGLTPSFCIPHQVIRCAIMSGY
jgi:hypothetical protein